jgi:hypothetical protein
MPLPIDDDVPPVVLTLVEPDYSVAPTWRELWHWYWPDFALMVGLAMGLDTAAALIWRAMR